MPLEARWLIKTGLIYLAAALSLGLVRAAQAAGWLSGAPAALWLSQLHFLTVGWLTQLIFGVAFWLFPNPHRAAPDGARYVVWIAYGALNGGLVLRLVAEPPWISGRLQSLGLLLAAGLQWVAIVLFAGYFWRRVRIK